jgi:hypothetical protein
MKPRHIAVITIVPVFLLWGCAGPPPPGYVPPPPFRPARPVREAPAAAANPNAHRFYIITFDARGVAHDRTGAVVTRERVLTLVAKKEINSHTGIRIEVPKGITDRDQSIEAFARAQQIARIFDLQGFEAVVVVLSEH